ncbi:MAG: nucleotidyltransferase domain-containing protein [Deltaproteobacteria bacterium]|nr:nucleotidyltransferase domain-containing protein [Deltaproteobacteria bacterium]
MANIPPSIEKSVQRFLYTVRSRYRIQAAYLYGSQAKGKATQWSDIDVAVVSPDFSDDLFEERLILMQLAAYIDDRIEPRLFKVETFNVNDPIANEIQKRGIRVA